MGRADAVLQRPPRFGGQTPAPAGNPTVAPAIAIGRRRKPWRRRGRLPVGWGGGARGRRVPGRTRRGARAHQAAAVMKLLAK